MKEILGLDLGITSIGWAQVVECEDSNHSKIKNIGVRVNPLTTDEQINFEKGKPITTNANRTLKRSMRRNLDRYQLRRKNLIQILIQNNMITAETPLTETGKNSTYETLALRSRAVSEKIELHQLARVLLMINKKRGYKSNRKLKTEDEGKAIDGMEIAQKLYEENITPGILVYQQLKNGSKYIPDFYRSDLQLEFDRIWQFQKNFYPDTLTDEFYQEVKDINQRSTVKAFWSKYNIGTAELKGTREEKRLQIYKLRCEALSKKLDLMEIALIMSDINNEINKSSGYLGAISDRSKELYFRKITVGQYLYQKILQNRHNSLKNIVFYRQDYLDEFEKIWETQSKYHPQLNNKLKEEIRDVVIFYQRRLKSQKGLIRWCELESKEVEIVKDGRKIKKIVGPRVIPRSSPLFQEFKIWQDLQNLVIRRKKVIKNSFNGNHPCISDNLPLDIDNETKKYLFEELNLKGKLSSTKVLELLNLSADEYELNYKEVEGNNTNKALYEAYLKILEIEGYDIRENFKVKTKKDEIGLGDVTLPASEIKKIVGDIFTTIGIDTRILQFDAEVDNNDFDKQKSYQLWHLLYSYEGDNSVSGNEKLFDALMTKYGFNKTHCQVLANISFQPNYGDLSAKAIRKIYPYLKENKYSTACELAGYRHSKSSLTKEENENRELKPRLDLIPKNSLRNPVVEKILNQMVNLINAIIDKENAIRKSKGLPEDFKFDEIRIELARELKKNAKERVELTANINAAKKRHEEIANILKTEFNIKNPTKNDIIRYKLYEELKSNGYKDLYTNTYIPREKLFSKEIDIEHIIPQSRLFDDSFSNKTLVYRDTNLEKANRTAFDYIESKYGQEKLEEYNTRITSMYELGKKSDGEGISKAKYLKLLKKESEIGEGFIERDLRDSQYIAKKAKSILFDITRSVVSTSGSITDRLREDWNLINIMQELNFEKFKKIGLTEYIEKKDGSLKERIVDWSKRNDHRHHAVDALTVAFTKHNHIQYLNYLNARKNENHKMHYIIKHIEEKETNLVIDDEGRKKRIFKEPIPNFRQIAKRHLESILVSHKAKNKVVTKNKNKIAGSEKVQITLTPRGQLHNETIYGKYQYYTTKEVKIGTKLDLDTIMKVSNLKYREALLRRLEEYENAPQKAFGGKNAPSKNPIYVDHEKTIAVPEKVKLVWLEEDYSIRKEVTPENFSDEKTINKILDKKIKDLMLERLRSYNGNAKEAFSDLDKNPIWLNKEKGIKVKRVTISGVKNAESLSFKRDYLGMPILDKFGQKIPAAFVNTGNNHHVAIYKDKDGNLHESVVSFFEAVARVNQGLPIIDKEYNSHLGWEFLFTMKQNEMFVFPNEETGFNPHEIDLLDPENKKIISPNLFRVQKIATKNYLFTHHTETKSIDGDTLKNKKELSGKMFNSIRSTSKLKNIIKVRLNHLGDITHIGE